MADTGAGRRRYARCLWNFDVRSVMPDSAALFLECFANRDAQGVGS